MPNKPYHYRDQWPIIAERLNTFQITPGREEEFESISEYHIHNKKVYLEVESSTGVPWPMTATIHRRENPSFTAYLGNGQPLSKRTTIVPKGRGPFHDKDGHSAFYWGCIDALTLDGLTKIVPPWPLEKMIFHLEPFNGLGYFNRGLPSPYIWGGSNHQVPGKYVADGEFDPDHWDTQPGCASILWTLGHLDPSIHYTRETHDDEAPSNTPTI